MPMDTIHVDNDGILQGLFPSQLGTPVILPVLGTLTSLFEQLVQRCPHGFWSFVGVQSARS